MGLRRQLLPRSHVSTMTLLSSPSLPSSLMHLEGLANGVGLPVDAAPKAFHPCRKATEQQEEAKATQRSAGATAASTSPPPTARASLVPSHVGGPHRLVCPLLGLSAEDEAPAPRTISGLGVSGSRATVPGPPHAPSLPSNASSSSSGRRFMGWSSGSPWALASAASSAASAGSPLPRSPFSLRAPPVVTSRGTRWSVLLSEVAVAPELASANSHGNEDEVGVDSSRGRLPRVLVATTACCAAACNRRAPRERRHT